MKAIFVLTQINQNVGLLKARSLLKVVLKPKSILEDSTLKIKNFWYDLGIKQNTDSYLKSLLDF
jgi:hypothetical protein